MSKTEIEYIEHEAIVDHVDLTNNLVYIRIDDSEECGDCPASRVCGSKGEPSNLIKIHTPLAGNYHKEDMVTVRGTEKMHRKAIMYATVFPCIILVAGMIGIYLLTGGNQLAAALSGLGLTFIFYFLLWLYRNKIAHDFKFEIVGPIERPGEMK